MAFKNKRFLKLMLAGMISVQVVGCGTSANNNTEKNSEVVTESETETEKASEGTESEIDSEKDTQVSTNDSETEVSESEKVEENKEGNKDDSNKPSESTKPEEQKEPSKPTHTCNYATLKTDGNNHWYACSCGNTANVGAHVYDDEYDASCNSCGYTRSVPEKPVENTTPSANVDWNGGNIYLESINISIPTMVSFNKKGLESTGSDWWWTGSENDKTALSAMNRIYLTCEDFGEGLVAIGHDGQSINGFTVSRNRIWFSWKGGDMEHFSLQRDPQNGYYVLTINQSLKSQDYFGIDTAVWNRDIVKTLCSFVSSKPNELFNYIYKGLYEDASILNTSVYKSVGDCQVKFDSYFYENENGTHCKFYIKPR